MSIKIIRKMGGIGDLLMMRLLFADLQREYGRVVFACPAKFHDVLRDHPYIDELRDSGKVNGAGFIDLTWPCHNYEMATAPKVDMCRADIWARECGVSLTKPDMHFNLPLDARDTAEDFIDEVRELSGQKVIAFAPRSAARAKSLREDQQIKVVKALQDEGLFVVAMHSQPLAHLPCPTIHKAGLLDWLCLLRACDGVVTVDTAVWHAACGLKKPCVGIFGPTHGDVAGKYYHFQRVQIAHTLSCNGPCHVWPTCPLTDSVFKPCMEQIPIESIVKAMHKALAVTRVKKARANV